MRNSKTTEKVALLAITDTIPYKKLSSLLFQNWGDVFSGGIGLTLLCSSLVKGDLSALLCACGSFLLTLLILSSAYNFFAGIFLCHLSVLEDLV